MLPIPTTTTLEKIQSCWQIPYIAHFCTLFNKYLDLPSFDTEDLEQSLLRDPLKENLVPELITRLLRKCQETQRIQDRIGTNTFEPFLELFIRKTCEIEKRPNPYHVAAAAAKRDVAEEGPLSFDELPVEHKAEVIQLLCEARFVANDAQTLIDQANPDSLRVLPLGYDSSAAAYYYFFGTRLYKESNRFASSIATTEGVDHSQTNGSGSNSASSSRAASEVPKQNGTAAGDLKNESLQLNGSLLNGSQLNGSILNGSTSLVNASVIHDDSVRYLATSTAEPENVRWELVCETEADWAELTKKLAKSKKTKAECALVKILEQNFLPNLVNLFRTKEKNERFSINKYVPVRASSRVRVLAEQRQLEELKQETEKYWARPLLRQFERQFRWSEGGIQSTQGKQSREPDPDADTENKRRTRNSDKEPVSAHDLQTQARAERAKKRDLGGPKYHDESEDSS